jgi:glutamate synthase (NADPH/NADH) large chain
MASEAGVLPESRESHRQEVAPAAGKMFLIDLEQGRIIDDKELKDQLPRQAVPQWIERSAITARRLPAATSRRETSRARPCSTASRPSATRRKT